MKRYLITISIILFLLFSSFIICGYDSDGYEIEISQYDALDIDNDGWENYRDRDDDGDGISDSRELGLARLYSPLLIFDDDEPCDVENEVVILYQVSPLDVGGDTNYVLLSFVVIYPEDYGADLSPAGLFSKLWSWGKWCYEGWTKIPVVNYAGEEVGYVYKKIKDITGINNFSKLLKWADQELKRYHCGDTEAIRFLLYCGNPAKGQWTLKKIIWKRHEDDPYYGGWKYSTDYINCGPYKPVKSKTVKFDDYGIGKGKGYHPLIYVSKRKHAMFPDKEFCENYMIHIEFEGDRNITPVLEIPYKFEKCDGGVALMVPTPMQLNVGESYSQNNIALEETIYSGIDPWSTEDFTGPDPEVYYVDCTGHAGSIGNKWCTDYGISNLNELPNFGIGESEGQEIEIQIDPDLLK